MKTRFRDKKAGIAILIALLIISVADVILRVAVFADILTTISNYGEVLTTAVFAILLLTLAFKGKDRAFYILCGTFNVYFVMDQIYDLPSIVETLSVSISAGSIFGIVSSVATIFSIISIIGLGVLVVKYMVNGTICNKAFNALSIISIALMLFIFFHTQNSTFSFGHTVAILASLNELSRLAMVFFFTFFAYDSAKHELKKTKLAK